MPIISWLRQHINEVEDTLGKIIIILAIVIITIRIIFPVRHLVDGYVLYAYPWQEFNICEINSACGIDRSRTAFESAGVVFLAAGLLYFKHGYRKAKTKTAPPGRR